MCGKTQTFNLPAPSTLEIKAIRSSETLITSYKTTRRYYTDNHNPKLGKRFEAMIPGAMFPLQPQP
jgi:hypothetical protein